MSVQGCLLGEKTGDSESLYTQSIAGAYSRTPVGPVPKVRSLQRVQGACTRSIGALYFLSHIPIVTPYIGKHLYGARGRKFNSFIRSAAMLISRVRLNYSGLVKAGYPRSRNLARCLHFLPCTCSSIAVSIADLAAGAWQPHGFLLVCSSRLRLAVRLRFP